MHLRSTILAGLLLLPLIPRPAAGQNAPAPAVKAAVSTSGTLVSLANAGVRVTFDLARGVYTARRLPDGRVFVLNAWCQAGALSSVDGLRFGAAGFPFADRLGTGCKLRVRGVGVRGPDLLLEFALYDARSFFTVRAGIINTTSHPLVLKEFYPLRAESARQGGIFAGPDPARDHRVLTGEGDTWCPRLLGRPEATSANVLLLTHLAKPEKQSLVLGGLTTHEFLHRVRVEYKPGAHVTFDGRAGIDAWIRTFDPAGKRVEPRREYLPDPALVDFSQPNPYDALERYAATVAAAMDVRLVRDDAFAPVCMWYLSGTSVGENTSVGALRETRLMKDIGLAEYAPPLARLTPNTPARLTEQLWWDDAHWKLYGYLVEPLDTVAKWTRQMGAAGAACELAFQPAMPPEDYAAAHPGQMLFNDPKKLPDATDPEFAAHLRATFRRLRDEGIRGLFFDTCGPLLLGVEGGFESTSATAVSAYRRIFALAREAAGPAVSIGENPNGRSTIGAEVATGLVDARRSESDKVSLTAQVVKRGVREWYRNRVTKLIDPDVKNFEPFDGDLLRAQVTAMATMFGKTMLGSSVTRYTPEAIQTLGRILPMPEGAGTARPIGLFGAPDDDGDAPNPEVYEYPLGGNAHLLLLWNHAGTRDKAIAAPLGGDTAFGGTGIGEDFNYDVWDFWDWQDMGRHEGGATLAARVRPGEMKTLVVHPLAERPYVLATTRHIIPAMGVAGEQWNAATRTFTGSFRVIGRVSFRAAIKVPASGFWVVRDSALSGPGARGATLECRTDLMGQYVELLVNCPTTREVAWSVAFTVKKPAPTGRPGTPPGFAAALDAAQGCVRLKWAASARNDDRAVRYLVYRHTSPDFIPGLVNRIRETIRTTVDDTDVRPGETYEYKIVAEDSNGNRSAPATARVTVAPAGARVVFNGIDGATGGNWPGVYGKDGHALYCLAAGYRDKVSLPGYVQALGYRGQKGTCLFTPGSGERRALAYSDATTRTRRLGALAAFQDLYVELKVGDTAQHAVALYFVNWEGLERRFTIEVLDRESLHALSAPLELTDFREGKYVQYLFRGSIIIKISRPESSNGIVLSGVFLDPPAPRAPAPFKTPPPLALPGGRALFAWPPVPGAVLYRLTVAEDPALARVAHAETGWDAARTVSGLRPGGEYFWKVEAEGAQTSTTGEGGVRSFTAAPAAAFAGIDDTTLGRWRARRGKAGYLLPAADPGTWGDLKKLPSFIESVELAGSQYYNWVNTGPRESPAAPESPAGGPRSGAGVFDHWFITVEIKARDAAEHTVSFYNWLGSIYPPDGVDAWVELLDPETGRTIDRRQDRRMLDGVEGRYYTCVFRGRMLLRLRNAGGPFCFLNGIFFEK